MANLCEEPFFSVVIPLYNKDSHIIDTLNSVLAQNFGEFEVVVVDDGSTDNSLICARSVQDKRIRVIEQDNKGVSSARNKGVEEAKGRYIAFLDADDHWYPWHLQELNYLISKYPDSGVYSVAHEILRAGITYYPTQFCPSGFKGGVELFFDAFAKSLALVNSTTACLPRDLLLDMGGFPEGVTKGEDVYVWLKAAVTRKLVYSDRICARYNQDAQCRSNRAHSAEIPYYLLWLDEVILSGGLNQMHHLGAYKLLRNGVFFNAAGYRIVGNFCAFSSIKKLHISKEWPLRFLLLILEWMPVRILEVAQSYRHRKVAQ